MKNLALLSCLILISPITAVAAVYFPNYELIDKTNIAQNCNKESSRNSLLTEYEKFYSSLELELPGVPPETVTYINQEASSENIKRRIEIQNDANYHVLKVRQAIKSILVVIQLIKSEPNKYSLKYKLGNALSLLNAIDYLNHMDLEYMYQKLEKESKVEPQSGLLVIFTVKNMPMPINMYAQCLIK